jgi:hypothetical protein
MEIKSVNNGSEPIEISAYTIMETSPQHQFDKTRGFNTGLGAGDADMSFPAVNLIPKLRIRSPSFSGTLKSPCGRPNLVDGSKS